MTNIIFYTLLLSISTSFGLGAMKYSTINRTFMLLQRSVFEYAVITNADFDFIQRGALYEELGNADLFQTNF